MNAISQQAIQTIRKSSLESITLSNDMKPTAVEERLRALNAVIKKLLTKKGAKIEILVMKGTD